jgi:hypothetical protein
MYYDNPPNSDLSLLSYNTLVRLNLNMEEYGRFSHTVFHANEAADQKVLANSDTIISVLSETPSILI